MRLFRESIDLLGECRDTAMATAKSDALQCAMPFAAQREPMREAVHAAAQRSAAGGR